MEILSALFQTKMNKWASLEVTIFSIIVFFPSLLNLCQQHPFGKCFCVFLPQSVVKPANSFFFLHLWDNKGYRLDDLWFNASDVGNQIKKCRESTVIIMHAARSKQTSNYFSSKCAIVEEWKVPNWQKTACMYVETETEQRGHLTGVLFLAFWWLFTSIEQPLTY